MHHLACVSHLAVTDLGRLVRLALISRQSFRHATPPLLPPDQISDPERDWNGRTNHPIDTIDRLIGRTGHGTKNGKTEKPRASHAGSELTRGPPASSPASSVSLLLNRSSFALRKYLGRHHHIVLGARTAGHESQAEHGIGMAAASRQQRRLS